MSKAKVYLAKSNKSNPNVVSRVRQTLSDYDVEIVEFTGGSYSHRPMVDCDFLVVVPELCESWFEDGVIVGKGLYEQLIAWEDNNDSTNVLFIVDFVLNHLSVSKIYDVDIVNHTNYIEYGLVEFTSQSEHFIDVLGDLGLPFKPKTSNQVSSTCDSDYYLLIGKKV
jgi:hypothetical protein